MNKLNSKTFRQFMVALALAFVAIFVTGAEPIKSENVNTNRPRVVVITHTPAPQLVFKPTPVPTPSMVPSPISSSTPYTVKFGEATKFPHDLDELYRFVEERERGYAFDACANDFEKPYLDWSMVKAIIPELIDDEGNHMIIADSEDLNKVLKIGGVQVEKKGVLKISENEAFGLLIQNELKPGQYFLLCSVNNDGYPTLYGPAVKPMIEDLEKYIQ